MPSGYSSTGNVFGTDLNLIRKICETCKKEKTGLEFYSRINKKVNGDNLYLIGSCISCICDKTKNSNLRKLFRLKEGEPLPEVSEGYKICHTCKTVKNYEDFTKSHRSSDGRCPRCRKCSKERRRQEDTVQSKQYHRDWHLRNFYKISLEEYERILVSQGSKCALCCSLPGKKPLRVDHDHSCCSGEKTCGRCIRGLLCANCNLAMERIDSISNWAEKATEYSKAKLSDSR